MTVVYIQNRFKIQLIPNATGKQSKNQKAKLTRKEPYIIPLLYCPAGYNRNISLRVDENSKFAGLHLTTKKKELYSATAKLRNGISKFLQNENSKENKQIKNNDVDTAIHGKDNLEINESEVKKKLRDVLPQDITDEAIDYIIVVLKKRGQATTEFGQIFGYKNGIAVSIEFGDGSNDSVIIESTGYKKNKSQMSDKELQEIIRNPMKYTVSYIEGKSNLATQHNHPPHGLCPPSLEDIQLLITQIWADYSFCISSKEIWTIEYKGGYYKTAYDEITKKVSKWETKAIELLKQRKYDEANAFYGNKLQKYFNNNEYNIKMYKVEL